ncbi:MAG: OmpH family outer membrane protein [Desulfovibrionaceae bacterium]|nr:OmpH family outer membrane protein [Desulfovibrionaceae bacterium]
MLKAKILLPLLALCFLQGACQQDQKSVQNEIAVVDLGRIISDSEPGKAAQAYVADLQKSYNDQLVAAQGKLQENSKDEKALQEFQVLFGNLQQRFQQEEAAATNTLLEKLIQTVADVRQQKGYKVIVRSEAVIAQDKGLDVTGEVMDAFNKVSIDFKAAAAEAAKEAEAAAAPAPADAEKAAAPAAPEKAGK